jgi:hypothetical protein
MSNITIPVPSGITKGEIAALIISTAGILTTLVIELYKRHYNAKQLLKFGENMIKLSGTKIALIAASSSALFTYLGALLFLAQSNSAFLSELPFVGKFFWSAMGVGYFLYNLRLSKWYKAFAAKYGNTKQVKLPPVTPVVETPEPNLFE